MDVTKLTAALPAILGKTVERVFLVQREGQRFQLFLAFDDGTHYEFYGVGTLSGARSVDQGDGDTIRAQLARGETAVVVAEVPAAAV